MKKIRSFTVLVIMFSFVTLSAQDKNRLYLKKWDVGSEVIINNVPVTRLLGENGIRGVTNVSYKTKDFLIEETKGIAENEMWTPEKLKEELDYINKYYVGGKFYFYFERLTLASADMEYFQFILKDSTDTKELKRVDFKKKLPSVPQSGSRYWRNYKSQRYGMELKGKYYIYIIDELSDAIPRYKFEITL